MRKYAIITISSHNYMPYGLTCILSARKYNPDCDFFYLIADQFNPELYVKYDSFIEFLPIESLKYTKEEIANLTFKYNIVEFNTCVKPRAIKHLLDRGYECVVYLDPDIECYSGFDDLFDERADWSIAVTPHKLTAEESKYIPDRAFLNNGIFNLGFLAVRNTAITDQFLNWWGKKLWDQCFIDYSDGLATDQIWLELASTIFDGFYVNKAAGYNVAFWNVHERELQKQGTQFFVNDQPLVFFHFSSLPAVIHDPEMERLLHENEMLSILYHEHKKNVLSYDFERYTAEKYRFSCFKDGSVIEKPMRWIYGYSAALQKKFKDPFSVSDVPSFKKWINNGRLLKQMIPRDKTDRMLLLAARCMGFKRFMRLFNNLAFAKRIASMLDLGEQNDN